MNYAIGVGLYIAFYIMGSVLPLFLGSTGSVFRLVAFSIPILLVMPRVGARFSDGQQLIPKLFRRDGGFLYAGGMFLIWLGHLTFFGSIIFGVYITVNGAAGLPIGLFTAYALYPYLAGIILVEIAFRQWSNRQAEYLWKQQQNSVVSVVGLIIGAQLVLNFTSDRPVDLLSYDEREAVALGRGYAREVQRVVNGIYVEEDRLPCASEDYFDPDSLLHSANRDLRKMLSIDLFECGQFVVTIHEPIDGMADGQLLYVASPGDADAGNPLEWQCISAHHERIERHTNGGCTYDGTLANRLPEPAETPTVAVRANRTLASPSVAPTATRPPGPTAMAAAAGRPSAPIRQSGPNLQEHLDRLAEPTLWEDCGSETTSYRLLRFDAGQYVAAVRVSHDSQKGAFRSVTSSSPDQAIGLDGWVDDRTWGRIEADFAAAGFWNQQSGQDTGQSDGGRVYLEACKNGTYHAVQSGSGNSNFASITTTFARIGKLEWLEN